MQRMAEGFTARTSPAAQARPLIPVKTRGVRRKGRSITGLSTTGRPNTISSLTLNRTGKAPILASRRLLLLRQTISMAITRQSAVPHPPMSTKVSKKVLE